MCESSADYEGLDLEALGGLENYYGWILETFRPVLKGHGIEFGAGAGTFSEKLLPHLSGLDLVEPSSVHSAILARRFETDSRVTIIPAKLEAAVSTIPADSRDCVILVNVLEHIEDDHQALGDLYRILKPGGHLLLFVPAMQGLYSEFDRRVGHFRRYHKADLKAGIVGAGFHIATLDYTDLLGVLPWWLINVKMGKTEIDPRMASLYDRVGVPLTRLLEALLRHPPFGKNLICMARKP
ncbi:putative Methyltransferase family protein [Magnetospira sp. QH-2]|nr:putative Methyltransferase family protein [Magnetospira sp. QH-2]